ncbi:transglutaminase-like domain-containing protein [Paracoccus spongiarum]|uniref:Transglutaminase family protein n=1 Tax=Paracoccus spongiarum TaxID=3064387 RepID=A0ABT9J8U2_9RHOB|nr:transglutaminase family protein [Paracoccus sp. 2205BS29-5]MDP5306155.1 transglutaminase family protein [Paracoccus sp. 2205BS29-5]
MLIRVGHQIAISTPQDTPLVCLTAPHPSRHGDFVAPEAVSTAPFAPIHNYLDDHGNLCRRMIAPAGRFALRGDVTLRDDGQRDPADPAAEEWPVEALPDEALKFLLGSRYVETDLISQEAWDRFGGLAPGWHRVQAVVDHVHGHLRFDYQQASATRTAQQANREGVGVCRDFAHLALAFLRALNLPARYVNGYVGDIGVPKAADPMDFAAWIEVFLGGRWWTFDPRNNQRRIGRVVVARGMDATDVPLLNSFGQHNLDSFEVWCHPVDDAGHELDGMLFA